MVPSAIRRRIVLTERDMTSAACSRLRYTGSVFSAIGPLLESCRRRGAEEATGFSHGDEEAAATVESCPPRTDASLAPVADGALWGTDECAELLEGEQSSVVPV